jgi:hypothetical protein
VSSWDFGRFLPIKLPSLFQIEIVYSFDPAWLHRIARRSLASARAVFTEVNRMTMNTAERVLAYSTEQHSPSLALSMSLARSQQLACPPESNP